MSKYGYSPARPLPQRACTFGVRSSSRRGTALTRTLPRSHPEGILGTDVAIILALPSCLSPRLVAVLLGGSSWGIGVSPVTLPLFQHVKEYKQVHPCARGTIRV